jgi:heat shock protein HslJ
VFLLLAAAGCGGDDTGSPEGSWTLTGGIDLTGAETLPTANLGDERVGGSTGCNRFNAPYEVEGDRLALGPIATTQIACAPPASDVERAYLAALERVAAWRLEQGELVLLDDADGELLRFTPA